MSDSEEDVVAVDIDDDDQSDGNNSDEEAVVEVVAEAVEADSEDDDEEEEGTAVEVEVVLGEVREGTHAEAAAGDPAELEPVGGDLEDGGLDPEGHHRTKQALEIQTFRGRVDGCLSLAGIANLDGSNQARSNA